MAAAAAGAVALAPLAAQAQAPIQTQVTEAGDPVAIRVGVNPGFTRLEFAGVIGTRSQVRQAGRELIVRIGSTAAPDVSRLRVDPPPGVEGVATRAVRGGSELVLTLADGASIQSGRADGAVWVNLYAPGAGPAAEAPAAPVNAVVPVGVVASDDKAVLSFRWPAPVGAAVFRRGEAVWVVFDAAARMDIDGDSDGELGPAGAARWGVGPDYTAVRIAAPAALAVSARAEGSTWIVTLGGMPQSGAAIDVARDDQGSGLVARMAGATRAIWLTDPMAGDRFAAVTARAPGKGLGQRRRLIDVTLLPSAHGLGIETPADDLTIRAEADRVGISRPRGLILSPPSVELARPAERDAPRKAPHPALILEGWGEAGPDGFSARYRALQQAAAEESIAAAGDPRTPAEARLALARFLVGSGLGYEAVGVLNALAAKTPAMAGEPEVRGLRAAARVSIGRLAEAETDLASPALSRDPSSQVWRGYIAAQRGQWAEARQAFSAGAGVIDQFPPVWRARFGAAHALAAVETGDLVAARALLTYSFSQGAPPADQLAARLVQARMFELLGETGRALAVYKAVARAPLDGIATPARLGVVKLELASGLLKPDQATAELERLRWRWRGDATELAVIRALGEIYLSQGLYREALDALRGAGGRLGQTPGAAQIHADLANAFRALFLDGAADGLQPVQALGLFYDFRELTPVGADGDEMVRRLARRLIDVDLLAQAAELLKYQADNRLDGVAKAQVASELATVQLMNRQPEAALQALWSSRTTLLPAAMAAERRVLEARALTQLGRYDHALEILARDQTPAAREVRAEIAWKQEKWAEAAGFYETRLGDRHRDTATPLSLAEETQVIRAGVGYSLGGDAAGLARLSRNYQPFVERARQAPAMRVALAGADGAAGAQDFAALSAGVDTFGGWVAAMKAQFRERAEASSTGASSRGASSTAASNATGGSRPATPARPQPAAPAASASAAPAPSGTPAAA